eukprot:629543-Ditylum_brightwellii.AAC.1
MDNGIVLLVFTLHKPGKYALANRRKPRVTIKNSKHVSDVWGSNPRALINIPLLVQHYNQWMGG